MGLLNNTTIDGDLLTNIINTPSYKTSESEVNFKIDNKGRLTSTIDENKRSLSDYTLINNIEMLKSGRIGENCSFYTNKGKSIGLPTSDAFIEHFEDFKSEHDDATLPMIQTYNHDPRMVYYDGNIYIVGENLDYDNNGIRYRSLYIYNIENRTWSRGADLPFEREWGSIIVYKDKIISCCEYLDNHILIYDIKTDSWFVGPQSSITRRYKATLTIYDDKLFIIGGYSLSVVEIEMYDILTNTLTIVGNLVLGRAYHQTIQYESKAYIISGNGSTVEIFDLNTYEITAGASIKTGRNRFSADLYNGKIYCYGGSDGSAAINTMEIYDIATNTWTYGAPGNIKRLKHRSVLKDKKIYIIGGVNYSNESNFPIEIYDIETNTWSFPDVKLGYNNSSTILADSTIYSFGGTNRPESTSTDLVYTGMESYNIDTNEKIAPLPYIFVYRRNFGCNIINDKVYISGGGTYSSSSATSLMFVYDIKNHEMESIPLPVSLVSHVSVSYGNDLYLIGGVSNNGVYKYNTITKSWSTVASTTSATAYGTGCVYNGKIYVVGGRTGTSARSPTVKSIFVYTISSNTWTTITTPDGFAEGAMELYNGKLYILYGVQYNTFSSVKYTSTVHIYDIAGNTWTTGATLPKQKKGCRSIIVDDNIYIFGGSGDTMTVADVHVYNITRNEFQECTPMLNKRSYSGVVYSNGYAFIFFGNNLINDLTYSSPMRFEIYDIKKGSITNTIPISGPDKLRYLDSVIYDDKMYIIGGENESSKVVNSIMVYDIKTNRFIESIDTPYKMYIDNRTASHIYNDNIYIVGSQYREIDINRLLFRGFGLRFNLITKEWKKFKADIFYNHNWSSTVFHKGKYYLIGGWIGENGNMTNSSYACNDNITIFDVETEKTTIGQRMPIGVTGSNAVLIDDKIYIMGGFIHSNTAGLSLNDIVVYDINSNTWFIETDKPETLRGYAVSSLCPDRVGYNISGIARNFTTNSINNKIVGYNFLTREAYSVGELKDSRNAFSASIYKDKFYIYGGRLNNTTTQTDTMETFTIPESVSTIDLSVPISEIELMKESIVIERAYTSNGVYMRKKEYDNIKKKLLFSEWKKVIESN
ncbi:MAG: kelch repeat-containing protein [Herbinix sp.]|nr:kelch repeat-containing protein [Herbinix sp.]